MQSEDQHQYHSSNLMEDIYYTKDEHALWEYLAKACYSNVCAYGYSTCKEGIDFLGLVSNRIPSLSFLNTKLSQVGWQAIPVQGLISPISFLHHLSKKTLPIAINIRPKHLLKYSPDPDIFHEAFGHACILIDDDLSNCLQKFGEVSLKAFPLPTDSDYFYRVSTLAKEKSIGQSNLSHSINQPVASEALMLSRLGWWTFECGLIGNIKASKLFGAALLSSTDEALKAFNSNKTMISEDCASINYDPTVFQEQYYVFSDKNSLSKLIDQLTKNFSFKVGGTKAVDTAIKSQINSTLEFKSGFIARGIVSSYKSNNNQIEELSFKDSYEIGNSKSKVYTDAKKSTLELKIGDSVTSAYPTTNDAL